MKSSEALRKARKLIESGEQTFVCHAFKAIRGQNTLVYFRIRTAVPATVSTWLSRNCLEFKLWQASVTLGTLNKEMREYRLAWIDWLIPQYEEIGD